MIYRRPYSYIPDDYFDFGLAGEHPVEFLAWIDPEEPGKEPGVSILRVLVKPTFPCDNSEWDVTGAIKGSGVLRERYEDEIRRDYINNLNKEYDEEVGA